MNSYYDPKYVANHYDEYGEREWNRFTISIKNEVNFFIHKHYLTQYVKKSSKVLELGAGPGRFTIELAKLDCTIAVVDISQKQLDLNKEKVQEAGYESKVLWRKKLDIVDLSTIEEKFDTVVIYGGALSYVFDKFNVALDNALSLLKDDGVLLLSVMSLQGTVHYFIKELFEDEVINYGLEEMDRVNKTGNLTGDIARGHICKLYTWEELEDLFEESNCSVIAASASKNDWLISERMNHTGRNF